MELLAHQGGWDEIALVLGPIAALAGILWLANRRAVRLEDEQARSERPPPRR
ncbi:MAG: hypothetical protein AAGK32_17550 [Actinomycetota bacterium]